MLFPGMFYKEKTEMNHTAMLGAVSTQEEFFYPDTPLGQLPEQLNLALPGLAYRCC